jgi:peptidoglycan/LPS O-acetylase OafA/YrhL
MLQRCEEQAESPSRRNLIRPAMPELDTIRGLAVLGVLFLHGFGWQYGALHFSHPANLFLAATVPGSLGVDLFFVLSGFLITGILLDSRQDPRYYARFYTRRALRILPVYYLLLLILLAVHSSSLRFVALSFIYMANMTDIFGVSCDYGPLWSLAVEEHYYLLWPMVVRNVNRARLAIVCLGMIILIPILRLVCFNLGWVGNLNGYTWFVADGLATGSIVAISLRMWQSRRFGARLCTSLLLSSTILGVAGRPFGIATRELAMGAALQQTTINLFFAGVLLLFLLLGTSSLRRQVNNRTLQFFGYISYGLYLDHVLAFRMYDRIVRSYWPALLPASYHFGLVVLKFTIAGGAAVGAAYLSRRYVEEWFLQLKDRLVWSGRIRAEVSIGTRDRSLPAAS